MGLGFRAYVEVRACLIIRTSKNAGSIVPLVCRAGHCQVGSSTQGSELCPQFAFLCMIF